MIRTAFQTMHPFGQLIFFFCMVLTGMGLASGMGLAALAAAFGHTTEQAIGFASDATSSEGKVYNLIINGVNQVAWQHSTNGTLSIWNTDANWNYTGSSFYGSATSTQGYQAETNFGLDLNGDGEIGLNLTYTNQETAGSVDLVTDNFGGAYARNTSGALDDITYAGNQMRDGYFAGWSLKAAETINGTNQVAWQHTSGNLSIWNTDANWNYTGTSFYGAASSAQCYQAETNFQQDFSGDRVIGVLTQEEKDFL